MAKKRLALGRGLSALIPEAPPAPPPASSPHPAVPAEVQAPTTPHEIDLDRLVPNREQPRGEMDDIKLEELAQSIRSSGVIQPILARPLPSGEYEIVAGERRWRAAQRAGLLRVPVVVRDVPDDKRLEVALIENIQRENLNPIDEARAYRRLGQEIGLTQEQISEAVGKDRATIANYQRLLGLPPDVQRDVAVGALSMGHARALLALGDAAQQRGLARDIQARGLSVRETERLVKAALAPRPVRTPPPPPDVHTRAAAERLRVALGTRVQIARRGRGGTIEIHFASEDELQRLFEHLTR